MSPTEFVKLAGNSQVRRFEAPGLAQYSYVIASEGEAVVIDAIRDFDLYTSYASEQGLRIVGVTETHIHADFASGSVALAAATGAELALSGYDQGEIYSYAMPHRSLKDGDVLRAGRLRLDVVHTPGHTPEHISFVLFDPEVHEDTPVAIFTGDFLFTGSLGRPDLLGEESKQGLARELYRSVHQRIAHLPDTTAVYPGHGAGSFCGAGIGAAAQSTLGHERSTQHLFQLGETDFVRELLAGVPPMPIYYPRMKRLNAAGAAAFEATATIPALAAASVLASGEQTILLDLRNVEEFSQAHIPGATNIGAGPNLPLWAGWLLPPNRPIVLLGATGDEAAAQEARRALARVGLDSIAGMLAGGMQQWIAQGQRTHSLPLLSPAEVAEAGNQPASPLLVDVRTSDEWQAGHIPGALNLPLGDMPRRIAELPPSREVITICGGGYRASAAASLFAAHGIRASVLRGGMEAWEEEKLNVTTAHQPHEV